LSEGITYIAQELFSGCTTLASVTLPGNINTIYSSAFAGCTRLTSVTLPEGLNSIFNEAFRGCTALTSVNIPNNVAYIGNSAFSNTGLLSVTWPAQTIIVGYRIFARCTNLTTVIISEGVIEIGRESFQECTALTGVTLPSTIWKIQNSAFAGCSSLTTLSIPAGVEWVEVASDAFSGATKLTLASQAFLRRLENVSEAVRQQAASAAQQRIAATSFAFAATAAATAPIGPGTRFATGGGGRNSEHWYRIQANGGTLTAYTLNGSDDPYMTVYNSSMRELARDDDSGEGWNARVSINAPDETSHFFIKITGSSSYYLHVEPTNMEYSNSYYYER
jgi:hypothetical protein